MRRLIFILFTISIIVVGVSAKTLKLFGCGVAKEAFAKDLAKEFSKKYKIAVYMNYQGGDIKTIKAVKEGLVDVGAGCRTSFKKGSEKGVWSIQVGWGALVFIVNRSNKVNNITIEEAKAILTGKIKNWKELGGENRLINFYERKPKKSGVGFSARVLLFRDIDKNFTKNSYKKANSKYIREAVLKDRYGFGIDDVTTSSKVKGLKILKVNGVYPSKENILNKSYLLARPLYLYSNGRPKGLTRKFIQFALSADGQKFISSRGIVNLREGKGAKHLNYLFQLLNN